MKKAGRSYMKGMREGAAMWRQSIAGEKKERKSAKVLEMGLQTSKHTQNLQSSDLGEVCLLI